MINHDEKEKLIEYYRKAVENLNDNPDSSVQNARKAAEGVCKSIIAKNKKEFNKRSSIENLLVQIENQKIPCNPKILLAVRTIQVYSNYGAHDQGFVSDSNEGVLGHHDDLSKEDVKPCMDALTQLLRIYIDQAIVDNKGDYGFDIEFDSKSGKPFDYSVKMAASNLTVPDSLMQGWNCEEIFSKIGLSVQKVSRKWNDQVLSDISDGTLDLAIYNKESTKEYIRNNPDSGIHIIRDVCSSMGGRNFYILASNKGKWKDMTLDQFKESLEPGTVIAVSRNSDMENNLLFILDMTKEELDGAGVTLFDYHSDQGLSIFDLNPNILVIAGQDLRFLAEKEGGYTEIIGFEDLPPSKRDHFEKASINSLIVGNHLYKICSGEMMENIANQLMINFYSNNIAEESRESIRRKLRPQVRQICPDDETADYIINRIMFETYRFF